VRYIAGTTEIGCKYSKGTNSELLGYSDSDHAGYLEKRKSPTRVVFFSWQEHHNLYIAAATGACQGVWLSRLLGDLSNCAVRKFRLQIDSKSALELSKNPVYHEKSKHIDTRYRYIRECIADGRVDVSHVGTDVQLADILTKPLGRIRFVEMRHWLGVIRVDHD